GVRHRFERVDPSRRNKLREQRRVPAEVRPDVDDDIARPQRAPHYIRRVLLVAHSRVDGPVDEVRRDTIAPAVRRHLYRIGYGGVAATEALTQPEPQLRAGVALDPGQQPGRGILEKAPKRIHVAQAFCTHALSRPIIVGNAPGTVSFILTPPPKRPDAH